MQFFLRLDVQANLDFSLVVGASRGAGDDENYITLRVSFFTSEMQVARSFRA